MILGVSAVSGRSVLRIRNWAKLVARGRSSRAAGPFGRMSAAMLGPVCGLRNLVRRRLLNLPGGAAAYGVWVLLVTLAAETCVPGVFVDDDEVPLTIEDLLLLTDVSMDEMRLALEVLAGPQVRLIETVSVEDALAVRMEPSAGTPGAIQDETAAFSVGDSSLAVEPGGNFTDDKTAVDPCSTTCDAKSDAEDGADEIQSWRLKVTATDAPPGLENGNLNQIEKQMSQLAGVCQQIDQMKRHVAAMSKSTPILTKKRKRR